MNKEDFFKKIQDRIYEISQTGSKALSKAIKKLLMSLDNEEGKVLRTRKNLNTIKKLYQLILSFYTTRKTKLLNFIIETSKELFNFNLEWFKKQSKRFESLDIETIKNKFFETIGFNKLGKLIDKKTTPLATLLIDNSSKIVGKLVTEGIKKGVTLIDLVKKVIALILPKNGFGLFETELTKNGGFDFFQVQDRKLSNDMAQDLGLDYVVYAGTKKDNTRVFCLERLNNIYDTKEVASWDNLKWSGKKKNQDSLVDCGGWGCRHHLNFVSEETAKRLASARGGINSYNQV